MSAGGPWSNQIVNKLIIAGPNGGEFLYAPTAANPSNIPGLNNLVESNVAVAGTDPTGQNAVLAGLTTYTFNAVFSLWFAVSHQQNGLYYFQAGSEAGPWTQITTMAAITRLGTPALYLLNIGDGSAGVSVNIQNPQHQALIAAQPGSGPPEVPETWHDLGTLAGYTVNRAQYKLGVENQAWLYINVTSGGANAASVNFSNTLPTAYRPTQVVFQPLTSSGASTAPVRVSLSAAGGVQVTQQANNAIQILGVVPIPLD